MKKIIMFLFVLATASDCFSQTIDLCELQWQFHKLNEAQWLPATVPGTVHTDLLANKKIEDPFYRDNEKKLQWIEKEDWEYKTEITIDQNLLKNDAVEMVFEGLDTYADVYLNDKKIIIADNMFRSWKADVKPILQVGKNQLRIYFHSPINFVMPIYNSLGYAVPVSNNDMTSEARVSAYSRKAGYHFGWDWGPRFVTSGIWRPAYIKSWNKLTIDDLFIKQFSVDGTDAKMEAQVTVKSTAEGIKTLQLFIDGSKTPTFSKSVFVQKGNNVLQAAFDMNNVELWWPNGMGNHKMYQFKAVLFDNQNELATKEVKRGIRTIEVVQESSDKGKSFAFKVNGKMVFMKGANYIPQDNFIPRVTTAQYEHIINTAVECNMNMLRLWGGGFYENDIFYNLCDEKGILIWHDFMFACSLYPPTENFKKSVYEEAKENIIRLRNHPSIAMWCGNNEITQFMNEKYWGQFKQKWRTPTDSLETIATYDHIFHEILPAALKAYDDEKFYWSSSPNTTNYSHDFPSQHVTGDLHYWGVWHGKQPFEKFNDNLAPFMSEYGFQSFPELETVKTFAIPTDYNIDSNVMKGHQKSGIGNQTIAFYMKDMFNVPAKFEDFLYVGQILQSEGIRMAIEAHRRAKPFCMGTLYWQINDCWPVASWSSMDNYGRWKALQYNVKKAYQSIIVSPFRENENINIYAVSDEYNGTTVKAQIRLLDFNGKVIRNEEKSLDLPENSSTVIYSLKEKEWVSGVDTNSTFIHVRLLQNDKELCQNTFFFKNPKNTILPKVKITVKQIDTEHIAVTADKLARFVWLYLPKKVNAFSDNYFDLLPGETKVLKVNTLFKLKDIKTKSLIDVK